MALNLTRINVPHIYNLCPWDSNFGGGGGSATSHFRVTGHFEKGAPNDSKWSWTIQGQMYPICITSVPEHHISVLFALWPAVFESQAFLRQVQQCKWPLNDLKPCKVKCSPYMSYWFRSQKFQFFSLYVLRFRDTRHFETNALNYDIEHYKVIGTHMYVTIVSQSLKLHSILFYDNQFSSYVSF